MSDASLETTCHFAKLIHRLMTKHLFIVLALLMISGLASGQTTPDPAPTSSVQSGQIAQRKPAGFDLSAYGVSFQADSRLIVVEAALEAAGFNPTPAGREPSVFRNEIRKMVAGINPDLRLRLRQFYERNLLPAPATAAEQAARYVSLALVLGQPPLLDAPERSEDLPGGLLEVLDFAPLVREFYQESGLGERLPFFVRASQDEGDRLRDPTAEMVRALLSYLHTQPITMSRERVPVKHTGASKKRNEQQAFTIREKERRFFIVPDLLAAPGTINFRVIGDDYYAIVPTGIDPTSSELRRAYMQFVIDPLVLRFNREIAARRDHIKQILNEQAKSGSSVTPDVFLAVSRSLVAAADARFEETRKLSNVMLEAQAQIGAAKDGASRVAISKKMQSAEAIVQDETVARLADDYERGAVLAFYFAEQLQGLETSGFDIANFLVDIISGFDPARELRRPAEFKDARQRAQVARAARVSSRQAEGEVMSYSEAGAAKAAAMVRQLAEVEETLRLGNYPAAEARLHELLKEYPREPRIFFALAQTASLAAADATDEAVQSDRLARALANYRFALEASSPETDRALISRAHEAMGRIHAFLEDPTAAAKEFDEAIKVGDVRGGAYKEALEGKRKLGQP